MLAPTQTEELVRFDAEVRRGKSVLGRWSIAAATPEQARENLQRYRAKRGEHAEADVYEVSVNAPRMHLLDQLSLHTAVERSAFDLPRVACSPRRLELARPFLAEIPTWWHFIAAPADAGKLRAAYVALCMLLGDAPNTCENWLRWHGREPDSRLAFAAYERDREQRHGFIRMGDYVRAMGAYDSTGVWEFFLWNTYRERGEQCIRVTGKTPQQLADDFDTAWACRLSLRKWSA